MTRLNLETLEARLAPAGVVTLNTINNAISFTGDTNFLGNQVRISPSANDHFLLTGLGGTTFLIPGKGNVGGTIDTSTITGFSFPNNHTTKLTAKFLGGNDVFEYEGSFDGFAARKFGDIVLDVGAGADRVFATQFHAKSLTIDSGIGTDKITIAAGGLIDLVGGDGVEEAYGGGIRGAVVINGQNGGDTVLISATIGGTLAGKFSEAGVTFDVQNSRVGGGLSFAATAGKTIGQNNLNLTNTQIGLGVAVANLGNGLVARVNGASIGTDLNVNTGSGDLGSQFEVDFSTVGGSIDYKSGALGDLFGVNSSTVGKNVTANVGAGGSLQGVGNSRIGGNLTLTSALLGFDRMNLADSTILGGVAINAAESNDTLNVANITVGLSFSYNSGNGGTAGLFGGGDTFDNSRIGGNLNITYGAGNDKLNLNGMTILGGATITNGDGADSLGINGATIGRNFAYTAGNGGNAGNGDVFSSLLVNGTFAATYGSGNDSLGMFFSTVLGAATIKSGDGANNLSFGVAFQSTLSITGGTGVDSVLLNATVSGTTTIATLGGSDTVSFSNFGRYHGKVTLALGGVGADNDTLAVQGEMTFLGGIAVSTGNGNDVATFATDPGNVVILNGLTYADAASLLDNVDFGANLFIL